MPASHGVSARMASVVGFRLLAVAAIAVLLAGPARAESLADVVRAVQPKIAKVYGAGGFRGLEPYQSGVLISAEGHILTAWSYVLDTNFITVVLNDGSRFDAKLLAADPRLELAVLKIEARNLPYFEMSDAPLAEPGTAVLAFSNLFGVATGDEAASVQHGVISVTTRLQARRGTYETPYRGQVYVLDAITNNPGAAGGALTDYNGRLLGMLGKELRNALNNTWLNYALPTRELADTVEQIRDGKFVERPTEDPTARPEHQLSLDLLGLVLVPDVLERTPPFVDAVRTGSAAHTAGMLPDDLVLFVNDRLVQSCKALLTELQYVDRADAVTITVIRDQELLDFTLRAAAPAAAPQPQSSATQRP